ncbi:MAG: higA [Magnetococcales bacterium]|nr:higA [Magnetococcales bacterium]
MFGPSGKGKPIVHPGEILWKEFMQPLGLSQNALARAILVPPRRINEIILGKRAVTADTDLRLCRYFGFADGYWLGLQMEYDLEVARSRFGGILEREIRPRKWTG